jgi:heme/copper-type cytochrome/quinol oxidase subunit 2
LLTYYGEIRGSSRQGVSSRSSTESQTKEGSSMIYLVWLFAAFITVGVTWRLIAAVFWRRRSAERKDKP